MKKTRVMTIGAMLMAIILLMALVPQFGFIQIGAVAITLIHIPVLIGAMSFKNYKLALISGATFGVASWFVAMTRPTVPTDFIFQNPMVSIVPRILFALIACVIYVQLAKRMKNDTLAALIATVIGCAFHTVSVLGMMYLFGDKALFPGGFFNLLMGVIMANGWIELIIAALIVPPVVFGLRKVAKA